MAYTPPTLATLRASVQRDLKDSSAEVFLDAEIDDLINWGIVEVNRIYPLSEVEDVTVTDDDDGNALLIYTIGCSEVSRIEVWRDGVFREQVPPVMDYANSGWDLFGSTLTLPSWLTLDDTKDALKVYGYMDRDALTNNGDVAETDAEAEMAIRLYSVMRGYQRLQHDRALFQQWLAIPGNKDISPTQLDGMANTYLADWNRHRNQMRRIRR
jgi:hypothetical protein